MIVLNVVPNSCLFSTKTCFFAQQFFHLEWLFFFGHEVNILSHLDEHLADNEPNL